MLFVLKIGTNLLTKPDFQLNREFIERISQEIIYLIKKNHKIVLVSSGAMASGRSELHLKKESRNIPLKQALCAVGQGILINTYREIFKKYNIPIAQILLTNLDFTIKSNFLSTRNTLNLLLELNALPVINENDVTVFDEIKCGDNDTLSAKVASMIGADLLILLTDVDGLYDSNPSVNPNAKLIEKVEKIDEHIKKIAGDKVSKNSRGGMRSKVLAAEYSINAGVATIIANGRISNVISNLILRNSKIGTYFCAQKSKLETRKSWMQPQIKKACAIIIDEGAENALKNKAKSLLPAGIANVQGTFERGDIIKIINQKSQEIGFGQTNYSNLDLQKIKGLRNAEIAKILDFTHEEETVHKDNMIVN